MTRIIDMWMPFPPTPEFSRYMVDHFPKEMLGYLRVFRKVSTSGNPIADVVKAMGGGLSPQQLVGVLDAAGIERALITGFDETSSVGTAFVPNKFVSPVVQAHPDRFIPFAGVDVMQGMEAVRELERLVREEGFRGLSLRPFMVGLTADDRRYYPFYSKCVELDIPVSVHTSVNWSEVRINEFGHPHHLDQVACDFPELKIIMSHGGYPWVLEAVMLAWKHPNLYLELAAHRPKYLSVPGTGWEPLFRFGPTTIPDKILFGTGWVLLGRPPVDSVNEFKALPVSPDVMEKWLHKNAQKLLRL